jgi:hypothetical protein
MMNSIGVEPVADYQEEYWRVNEAEYEAVWVLIA